MKNSMVLICSRSDGAGFDDLWVVEFGFSLSFDEFGRLGCVNGVGRSWWIWVWLLDWIHCSSFFLLVFNLIFSSSLFIYVLLIWVWVLGLLGLCSCDGFEFLVVRFDLERIWRTSCKMKNKLKNMKNIKKNFLIKIFN